MIYLLAYVLSSYIAMCTLYSSYVLLMDLITKFGKKSYKTEVLVILFISFDVFCNFFIVTVWSLDLPRELTVTARLKRWRRQYEHTNFNQLNKLNQYKLLFAVWLCDSKLDRDDVFTRDHC